MKVKVGQLKAHLSQYLREIEETGEPIEVCVRERGVAYLTPVSKTNSEEVSKRKQLEHNLQLRGLEIREWGENKGPLPKPGKPGDGKIIENTIVAIRQEKDW